MIGKLRGRFHQSLQGRILGVENAKRVGVQAPTAVFIQQGDMLGEVCDQRRSVGCAL